MITMLNEAEADRKQSSEPMSIRPAPGACCPEENYELIGQGCNHGKVSFRMHRCRGCGKKRVVS